MQNSIAWNYLWSNSYVQRYNYQLVTLNNLISMLFNVALKTNILKTVELVLVSVLTDKTDVAPSVNI